MCHFGNKGLSSQGCGFSSGHTWMWELDCEEIWVPKYWCFWTVVLEKTLESPLDCREIQQVLSEGDQARISLEGMMLKLKLQYFGHLMRRVDSLEKTDAGRDWGQEEKGMTEGEMAGWHHWLDGHGFGWTPGVGDGQGGLECCDSWGRKESDTTEQLNWTELMLAMGLPWWLRNKESACHTGDNARDASLIPGSGRFPGGRHGNPL